MKRLRASPPSSEQATQASFSAGYFFLDESLTASKAIGVVVILVGIDLVAR